MIPVVTHVINIDFLLHTLPKLWRSIPEYLFMAGRIAAIICWPKIGRSRYLQLTFYAFLLLAGARDYLPNADAAITQQMSLL